MNKALGSWVRVCAVTRVLAVSQILAIGAVAFSIVSGPVRLMAQQAEDTLAGDVFDQAGKAVPDAAIVVKNDAGTVSKNTTTNADGHFNLTGLPSGLYSIQVSAPGFAANTRNVQVGGGASQQVSISLGLATQSQSVEVMAVVSLAAQTAPSGNTLDTVSARTEVSGDFIKNFESPVADFGEYVNYAPGTYTLSPNGVGLGQGKTFFRSFPNGDYTMTFDGVPFQDTNSISQHSWANFPVQWIGGVDFDRSPGTASTIGPANFGGSINLLSKDVPTAQSIRLTDSYGSWSTNLLQLDYDAGQFGPGGKSSLLLGVHQLKSDGYETFNYQKQDGGDGKYLYKFSPRTYLSVVGGMVDIWNNTPNVTNPTRQQVQLFGDNYLMDSTPVVLAGSPQAAYLPVGSLDPYYYGLYTYHVQTDFENVDFNSDLGDGWRLDNKLFTYRYWNKQQYQNGTTVTTTLASPTGVDKLNGYRQAGDILSLSKESKWGVLRFGAWYNWAYTDRYQYPDNPITHLDTPFPNFHEHFNSQSFQPFVEYEWRVTSKFVVVAGVKDANYDLNLQQYQVNGKIFGCLGGTTVKKTTTAPPLCIGGPAFIGHGIDWNNWLPSIAARYRVARNWSIYGQFGEGSITPPTAVFDVPGGLVTTPLAPQVAKTYHTGSVMKHNRWTLDLDAYYIHYGAGYQSYTDPATGEPVYTQTGPLNTKGIEAESNIAFGHGLSLYLNGSIGNAKYQEGPYTPNGGLWVAGTPKNVETYALLYQKKNWDVGFVEKRVGTMYNDNTGTYAYTNPISGVALTYPLDQAVTINPFDVTNIFVNYTIKNDSWLRGSKIGLSVNNLLDSHNVVGVTPGNTATTFGPYTQSPSDQLNLLPGRSIMATFTVGFTPKR